MRAQRVSRVLALFLVSASVACGGFGSLPTAPDSTAAGPSPSVSGSSVDLGNPADESQHSLQGWGESNPEPWYPPEADADRTSRFQLVRLPNSVDLSVPQAGITRTLVFRTQDGSCDDSFDVYVNGTGPLYKYRHRVSSDRFPIHRVPIDASILTSTTLTVTFLNVAVDNCGFAATYFVRTE